MNQQPDKLFRDKLENHSRPVSINAWNRVEAKLDKKNHKGLWLRIAASLLIVAISGFIIWKLTTRPAEENLAETIEKVKKNVPSAEVTHSQEDKTSEKQLSVGKGNKTGVQPSPSDRITPPRKKGVPSPQEEKDVVTQESIPVNEESLPETLIAQEQPVIEENVVVASTQNSENVSPKKEAVTIVFTADEVNDKYLDKKSLEEATSGDKKPSTLRKLLDKAYDLKNNEDPFGDLRQKKNEILALNFKNDKQRSENK